MERVQVESDHYEFKSYFHQSRWISYWHQLNEIFSLRPESVLEIGPGIGFLKKICGLFDLNIKTVDIDPELEADYVGSITNLPFNKDAFDLVCAFQILEHLPYEKSLLGIKEMARVAKNYILISIPDAGRCISMNLRIPFFGVKKILIPFPNWFPKKNEFDGQHYWEINKKGFSHKKIMFDFNRIDGIELKKSFRPPENPYHRFFLFKVVN